MKDPADRRPEEGDGFLGRWARRKSALRRGERPVDDPPEVVADIAEAPLDEAVPVAAEMPAGQASPAAGGTDPAAAPVEKPPLPALDTLTPDSDFSAFMSRDVDAALRRAALRKLFHTPAMNITDGLDDYAEDYTNFAPLGDMITADMRHQIEVQEERAERARLAAEEQAEAEAALGSDETPADAEQERLASTGADEEAEPAPAVETESGAVDDPPVEGDAAGEECAGDEAGVRVADEGAASAHESGEETGNDSASEPPTDDDEVTARHNAAEKRRGDQTRG